jgi:hypothetical protein
MEEKAHMSFARAVSRWAPLAVALGLAGAVGGPMIGCSSNKVPPTGASSDAIQTTSTNAPAPGTSVCTGGGASVDFKTALPCDPSAGACSTSPLWLSVSTAGSGDTEVQTYWFVRDATGALVMNGLARIAPNNTLSSVVISGNTPNKHTFWTFDDGTTITGAYDNQAFAARAHSATKPVGPPTFASGAPLPAEDPTPAALQGPLRQLMAQAQSAAPSACASGLARTTNLVPLMQSALPQSNPSHTAVTAPPHPPTLPAPAASGGVQPDGKGTPAPIGYPADFDGASVHNTPLNWITQDCNACEKSCAESWVNRFVWPALLACMADCFIPGEGCAENICRFGGSCDSNQTCCGQICCGPGTVCGDPDLGICCPSSEPVGCGNNTLVTCFAGGSSCCGDLPQACGPGSACYDVSGTGALCCPPSQTTPSGECCQKDACGGSCCDQGSCVNGQCCLGGVDANGQCCGGLDRTVCNGACCNGSCTASGACCAAGSIVCGSACCGAGQICQDASSSTCGSPTGPQIQLLDKATSTVISQTGWPTPSGRILQGQAVIANLDGFNQGTVTISYDSVGGPVINTAKVFGTNGNAAGSLLINTNNLATGDHTIVAWETVGGTTIQTFAPVYVDIHAQ